MQYSNKLLKYNIERLTDIWCDNWYHLVPLLNSSYRDQNRFKCERYWELNSWELIFYQVSCKDINWALTCNSHLFEQQSCDIIAAWKWAQLGPYSGVNQSDHGKGMFIKCNNFCDFFGNCFGLWIVFRKLTAVFKCLLIRHSWRWWSTPLF